SGDFVRQFAREYPDSHFWSPPSVAASAAGARAGCSSSQAGLAGIVALGAARNPPVKRRSFDDLNQPIRPTRLDSLQALRERFLAPRRVPARTPADACQGAIRSSTFELPDQLPGPRVLDI